MPGTLFVVATPIGNLEDVTARALRVLREVDVIAAEDTRRTARLLARYAITTPSTSLHAHNERSRVAGLVRRLLSGESVAVVSDAGTPTLSDPGSALVKAAIEAGIRVEPIPGASAITTLLSASGLSAPTFKFMGFPPPKGTARKRWFSELGESSGVVVFFEAPHRIKTTIGQVRECCGNAKAAIGRELTKQHEQIVRGELDDIISRGIVEQGEFTVAVEIGHITENVLPEVVSGAQGARSDTVIDRKMAVEIAAVLGLKTNYVYDAFLRARKLAD